MTTRSESRQQRIQSKLELLIGEDRVYYDPPESVRMRYPCIVFSRRRIIPLYADNVAYNTATEYEILYISRNPDDDMLDAIYNAFSGITHSRHFVEDNLHHDVFYVDIR